VRSTFTSISEASRLSHRVSLYGFADHAVHSLIVDHTSPTVSASFLPIDYPSH
jgi:hypothetical protein